MRSLDTVVVEVREEVDAFLARSEARGLAARSGFNSSEVEEIARLATALASGVLRRGAVGAVHLRSMRDSRHGPGILIMSIDKGAPIPALQAVEGLEDARRLSHSLTLEKKDGSNVICAARWVCAPPAQKLTR
jgi:hypothetical protein